MANWRTAAPCRRRRQNNQFLETGFASAAQHTKTDPLRAARAPSSTTMMLNLRDNWSLATKTHWATNASLNAESFSL